MSGIVSQPTSIIQTHAGPKVKPLDLDSNTPLPPFDVVGPPAAYDIDDTPVYLGLAPRGNDVHPCKVVGRLFPRGVRVPYGDTEEHYNGKFTLMPYVPSLMEWVSTSHGDIPEGRVPVDAGHENGQDKLYHALGTVNYEGRDIKVPGKCGKHLDGCHIAFDEKAVFIREHYEILCWKNKYHIQLETDSAALTDVDLGPPVAKDAYGADVYMGSVAVEEGIHPCKVVPAISPFPVCVAYGEKELRPEGPYLVLPFDPQIMEFVPAAGGQIPGGRQPVDGGYDGPGQPLYHARAKINGMDIPGKCGVHLGGCHVSFDYRAKFVQDDYEILCWKSTFEFSAA